MFRRQRTLAEDSSETCVAARGGEEIGVVKASVQGGRKRLTAGDERPPATAPVPIVLLIGGLGLHDAFDNLLNVANLDKDILGLEVGVDDAAFAMEVVEAEENLLGDLLHKRHRDAAMVPALDQAK